MSESYNGVYVAFEKEVKSDGLEMIISAIRMIKNVQDVKENITNSKDYMVKQNLKFELRKKLWNAFEDVLN